MTDRPERTPELTRKQIAVARARRGERVAMVCPHADCQPPKTTSRGFDAAWTCPTHGVAVRQPNQPYFGEPT